MPCTAQYLEALRLAALGYSKGAIKKKVKGMK